MASMKNLPVLQRARILALLLLGIVPALHSQKLVTFDVPGSSYTHPTAINLIGQITGYYSDSSGYHGFVRQPGGSLTSFDVPLNPGGFPPNAIPMDINAEGQIAGFYAFEIQYHGFLRQPDGTIVQFTSSTLPSSTLQAKVSVAYDLPTCGGEDWWLPFAINDLGQITGSGPGDSPGGSGFVRAVDGTLTYFDVPPQFGVYGSTCPHDINVWGQVIGYYVDGGYGGIKRGFLRQPDGSIVRLDQGDFQVTPIGINFFGQITGVLSNSTGSHAFIRQLNGAMTFFDGPGGALPAAINALGEVTGICGGSDGLAHGFLREPNGQIITFVVPKSQGTFPQSINFFGKITGYYFDGTTFHGFVRDR